MATLILDRRGMGGSCFQGRFIKKQNKNTPPASFIYMHIPLMSVCKASVCTQNKRLGDRYRVCAPPTPHPRALSSNFRFIFCPLSSPDLFNFALDVAAQWELFWPVLWKWWRPGCSPPPLLSTSLKSSSVLWMEPASLAWLLRGLCIVSSKENFSSSRRPSVSSAFQQPNMWGIKGL